MYDINMYYICIHIINIYTELIYIYIICVYIYLYAQRLGFAQALQRRGSHSQTNVDATSQNSNGKNNKGPREY